MRLDSLPSDSKLERCKPVKSHGVSNGHGIGWNPSFAQVRVFLALWSSKNPFTKDPVSLTGIKLRPNWIFQRQVQSPVCLNENSSPVKCALFFPLTKVQKTFFSIAIAFTKRARLFANSHSVNGLYGFRRKALKEITISKANILNFKLFGTGALDFNLFNPSACVLSARDTKQKNTNKQNSFHGNRVAHRNTS